MIHSGERNGGKPGPFWLLLLVLGVSGGCSSLPDVQPFAQATGNLATAVSSAGSHAEQQIANSYDPTLRETKAEAEQRARDFKMAWEHRARVVDAFSQYTDGLVMVVQAGNDGKAAARQVTDGFVQLLDTVKPGFGIEAAGSAIAAAAQEIYGEYARHRAAATLSEAVTRNQPYVRQLAQALNGDWVTLEKIIDSSFDQLMTIALAESEHDRAAIAAIEKQTRDTRKMVIIGINEPPTEGEEIARLQGAKTRLDELERLREQIAGKAEYQESLNNVQTLKNKKAELLTLVDQAQLVTAQWATAHHDLALALRDRRPVSFRRLLQLSEELMQIQQKAREK